MSSVVEIRARRRPRIIEPERYAFCRITNRSELPSKHTEYLLRLIPETSVYILIERVAQYFDFDSTSFELFLMDSNNALQLSGPEYRNHYLQDVKFKLSYTRLVKNELLILNKNDIVQPLPMTERETYPYGEYFTSLIASISDIPCNSTLTSSLLNYPYPSEDTKDMSLARARLKRRHRLMHPYHCTLIPHSKDGDEEKICQLLDKFHCDD